MTDEAPAEPAIPNDETHDSIDPQSGALTAEAVARRAAIVEHVQRHSGSRPASWAEALGYWLEHLGGQAPEAVEDDPGLLEPPPPEPEADHSAGPASQMFGRSG